MFYFKDPDKLGPKYNICEALEGFNDAKYGILAGPAFTLVYSVLVLFSGSLSDKYSRKLLFGSAAVCWSLASIGAAFS